MGLFGGSAPSFDFGFAETQLMESGWLNDALNQQIGAANQPFLMGGGASYSKLLDLLGVDQNDKMKYKDFDSFYADAEATRKSGNPAQREGRNIYYDPVSGQISGVNTGGAVDLGIKTLQGTDEENRAALQSVYDDLYSQDQNKYRSDNFGSLLDRFTLDDFQESPNYQFNLSEGEKALNRAAASRGNYNSPSAIKDLLGYSQNLASNEYLNSYNMDNQYKNNVYNMLSGSAGMGQQGINTQMGQNAGYYNNDLSLRNNRTQLDFARQAQEMANDRGSAFGSALGGIAGKAIGGSIGGPFGAQIGGQLGGWAGGQF